MTEDGPDDASAPDRGPESLVLAAFDDPEPLTAGEVADATGMDPDEAETALDALVTAGRLGRKTVAEATLWYPTPGRGNGTTSGEITEGERSQSGGLGDRESTETADWGADEVTVRGGGLGGDDDGGEFDEARVESAVADLDVPGTSEMMRDWRRAAVRAAFDYLRENGPVDSDSIIEAVYSGHRAGYSDADAWWGCVAPRLETLPGVERDGEEWTFAAG